MRIPTAQTLNQYPKLGFHRHRRTTLEPFPTDLVTMRGAMMYAVQMLAGDDEVGAGIENGLALKSVFSTACV
jgi:hypothetical protein